ncbi:MAG: hypothetical protein JF614_11560 [Acidobacteria bacterium]|nr:hypothetical protein [Acidobacteriota bacterium]
MGRLLVLLLLLYILWLAVQNFMQKLRAATGSGTLRPQAPIARSAAAPSTPSPEILLACAACGTYVPASRALPGGGTEVFCSEECRSRRPDP